MYRWELLYFGAEWCAPCKAMQQILGKLKEDSEVNCVIEKVDIEKEPELTNQYNVTTLPTLLLTKNNTEVKRRVGTVPYEQLKTWIKEAQDTN